MGQSYLLRSESGLSCLMVRNLYQTGTTGYSSNQERTWLQQLPPTHVQLHTTKTANAQTHTHSFIPGYVSSPGCQSNIHNNILLDFQQQHLSLPACLFPFFFIIFCKKRNHNMRFVNIAEEPLFHSPCLYYCDCALSDKACLYY